MQRKALKENGILNKSDSSFDKAPEPAKGTRRFEAKAPSELYQMDARYGY